MCITLPSMALQTTLKYFALLDYKCPRPAFVSSKWDMHLSTVAFGRTFYAAFPVVPQNAGRPPKSYEYIILSVAQIDVCKIRDPSWRLVLFWPSHQDPLMWLSCSWSRAYRPKDVYPGPGRRAPHGELESDQRFPKPTGPSDVEFLSGFPQNMSSVDVLFDFLDLSSTIQQECP